MSHIYIGQISEQPRYRNSQTAIGWDESVCARNDAIAAEDHSKIATTAERSRNENSWKLVVNTSCKNGPLHQRDDYQEAKELMTDCIGSMDRVTPKSTLKTKSDNAERNHLIGTKKELTVSIQERVGSGTTIHQQVRPLQVGKQLHGGHLHHGVSDIFLNRFKEFSLTGNGDSFVSDRECTQDTKPARNVTFLHT